MAMSRSAHKFMMLSNPSDPAFFCLLQCQESLGDLVAIETEEEHKFLVRQLELHHAGKAFAIALQPQSTLGNNGKIKKPNTHLFYNQNSSDNTPFGLFAMICLELMNI